MGGKKDEGLDGKKDEGLDGKKDEKKDEKKAKKKANWKLSGNPFLIFFRFYLLCLILLKKVFFP